MYKNFADYIWGMIGMHGSMEKLILDMTDKLVNLRIRPNNTEIVEIPQNKLIPGHFYLIQYNFNGNLIWCPILALDYKVIKNKHILYAVNLEYLPPRYKMLLFDKVFKPMSDEMDIKSQEVLVKNEAPIKHFNFEFIYKLLKNNGNMNYAITAYTIIDFLGNVKIKRAYKISIKILPEIIMADMKRHNSVDMLELHGKLTGDEQIKMSEILENYNKMIDDYQADSIQYHKKVALFREKLKLFK